MNSAESRSVERGLLCLLLVRDRLGRVLAADAFFLYDFSFVPSTLADDGDAIDGLVLLERLFL